MTLARCQRKASKNRPGEDYAPDQAVQHPDKAVHPALRDVAAQHFPVPEQVEARLLACGKSAECQEDDGAGVERSLQDGYLGKDAGW